MKKEIERLLREMKEESYDYSGARIRYESVLEDFAVNYNVELLPLILELINLPKHPYWYS